MKIIQTVHVYQILTSDNKRSLLHKFEAEKAKLLKEVDQLSFQLKRLDKMNKRQHSSVETNNHLKKGLENRREKISMLDFKMDQVQLLPLGSEIKETEVQAIVDVNIGDEWEKLMNKKIVIKDGVVDQIL